MIQPVNTLFPENRTAQELEAFRQAVPANAVLTVFKNFAPGLDKQIPHSDSDESLAVVFRFPGLPDAIAGSIRGMQSYHNWLYYRIEADGRKGGYHYSRYQPATFVEDYVEVLEEALGRKIKVEYSDTVLENLQWAVTPTQEQHGRYHIFGGLHDSVKAVVFDLDNTLADTRQLEPFRRNQDRQGLETALCSTQPYVHEDLRRVLRETSDVVPIAIVTVSPRWYAERLLNTLFPDIEWNAIVTYGDVDRPKPFPDGLRLAAEKLNVNPEDVLVVGDSRDDVEAAYHAGMQVALATWHVTDPEAIRFIPDAVMEAPEGVLVYLTSPTLCLPYLEAWLTDEDWEALDYLDPYPAFTDVPGQPALPVSVLGRYFPNYDQTLDLHSKHLLSQQIISKENPEPFKMPEAWGHPLSILIGNQDVDVVTVVPAKPGKDPRLERMLEELRDGDGKEYIPDLLEFIEGTPDVKRLSASEKYESVKQHMRVKGNCTGRRVLVLDDVLTQGATMQAATELLLEAGATSVERIALARTISPTLFHVRDEVRFCPDCGATLKRYRRKWDGKPFWGCPNYFSQGCQYTEDMDA